MVFGAPVAGLGPAPGGDPDGLRSVAQLFEGLAIVLANLASDTGRTTRAVTAGGTWSGLSATIYRAEGAIAANAIEAGAAAYRDAAGVVLALADEIQAAQTEARNAESLFQQEQETARTNPLAATSPTWTFPSRAQHDAAHQRADAACQAAAARLRDIANRTKPKPTRKHKPKKLTKWGLMRKVWNENTHIPAFEMTKGAADSIYGLGKFNYELGKHVVLHPVDSAKKVGHTIVAIDKAEIHAIRHPLETAKDMERAAKWAYDHPDRIKEYAKTLINWKLLKENPDRWVGQFIPDIAAIVLTDGAAAPEIAAMRGEEGIIETERAASRLSRAERAAEHVRNAGRISLKTYELMGKTTDPFTYVRLARVNPISRRATEEIVALRQRVVRSVREGPVSHELENLPPMRTWDPGGKPYAIGSNGRNDALAGVASHVVHDRGWGFRPGLRLAEDANRFPLWKGDHPPYRANSFVTDHIAREPEIYVRVYSGEGAMQGGWLMRQQDIVGLSRREIQQKYALPKLPDHIVMAEVQPGAHVREGIAGAQPQWGNSPGGGIQIQLMDHHAPVVWGKPIELPEEITPALIAKELGKHFVSGENIYETHERLEEEKEGREA